MSIEAFANILKDSNNIVFFGGAGVSTASGIPDFRSSDGIFNQKLHRRFSPEELVSHGYLTRYPEDFYEFYRDKLIYPEARPNACHFALAELEKMGKLLAVVTQNIDGLHQMAGSQTVYELHGSVLRNYCSDCGEPYDGVDVILESEGIPLCKKCGGIIRPDVVLYGECLDDQVINGAVDAIAAADTLIIGGTSLVVYPAAGFIEYFRGKHMVLINKSVTSAERDANLVIHDDIAKVFSEAMKIFDKI